MAQPSPGIRQVNQRTAPIRALGGALHIAANGPDQSCDRFRLKLCDGAAEQRLAGDTSPTARMRVKLIDGARTKVDQIAAGNLKH
jgi:hypothetical protein